MNEIKERIIKLHPEIKKLSKEIHEYCRKENKCFGNCPFFYDRQPNLHQITCILSLLEDTKILIGEMIKQEKLKEKSNA